MKSPTKEQQMAFDEFDLLNKEVHDALARLKAFYKKKQYQSAIGVIEPHNSKGQELCIPISFRAYLKVLPEVVE